MGDVLKKKWKKKKWKNNILVLLSLFFVLPIILSFILVLYFKDFLAHDFVTRFLSISGYLFTLSALILVFILFNTFKVSDYKRSMANEKFLEKAFDNLPASLTTIKSCLRNNEPEELYESCGIVRGIFKSLQDSESDVDLKAYESEIKAVVNLINKHHLTTIGFDLDFERLKAMSADTKRQIAFTVDDLLLQLEQRSSLNEE